MEVCNNTLEGTQPYTAPEVLLYAKYNYKSDIFSLGATFFRILFNRYLYKDFEIKRVGPNQAAKFYENGIISFTPEKPVSVSKDSILFLEKCLQFNPKKRFSLITESKRFIYNSTIFRKPYAKIKASVEEMKIVTLRINNKKAL